MEYWSDGALQQQGTQGRSCQYHHPERMEITQPSQGKGALEISFFSHAELERILQVLGVAE